MKTRDKIGLLFLQYDEKTEEPGRNGWLLLSALNLLGAEGDSYAEVSFSYLNPLCFSLSGLCVRGKMK